jgi:hypothetical protein
MICLCRVDKILTNCLQEVSAGKGKAIANQWTFCYTLRKILYTYGNMQALAYYLFESRHGP